MFDWRRWLYGLASAIIGAAASAAGNVMILPVVLNTITFRQTLVVTGLNAAFAGIGTGLAYLKTHPLPEWDGISDRRDGRSNGAATGV